MEPIRTDAPKTPVAATAARPAERSWARVAVPHAGLVAVATCAIVFAALLYITRSLDFFYDDWDFVLNASSWGVRDYFEPHNQHWSTVPQVIYKVLLEVNGMRSYMPFMAVLLGLHAGSALLLFNIVRRRSGGLLALVAMTMFLFMGRGWMDILWAFQIGFVGSIALGLLATYLLDFEHASPQRLAMASVSLVLSVMCSGVGLLFCVAVAADLLLDPTRRARLQTLAPAAVSYGSWYLAIGRQPLPASSPLNLAALITFVPYGMGAAAAGIFSLSAAWSQLALAALSALAALVGLAWFRSGRLDSRIVGAAVGFAAQYALTGLVRSQFGDADAASSRYVYVGAVFLLLALSGLARDLPWRRPWPVLLGVLALTVVLNAEHLRQAAAGMEGVAATQRTELSTLWLFRNAPGLDHNATVDSQVMPQVRAGKYIAAREVYGAPIPSITYAQLSALPTPEVNRTLESVLPLRVTTVTATDADRGSACTPTDRSSGLVEMAAPGGNTVDVHTQVSGQVNLYIWLEGSRAPDAPAWNGQLMPTQELVVRVPDTGAGASWHLQLRLPVGSSGLLCTR